MLKDVEVEKTKHFKDSLVMSMRSKMKKAFGAKIRQKIINDQNEKDRKVRA